MPAGLRRKKEAAVSFLRYVVLKLFYLFALFYRMFDAAEIVNPAVLFHAYGKAERGLGKLAHALRTTPLHTAWLWRELTRTSVMIAQIQGYRAQVGQLRMALIGAPVERHDNTPGLAAAKRVFLAADPLFRSASETDSNQLLLPTFWDDEGRQSADDAGGAGEDGRPKEVVQQGQADRQWLLALVHELAGFADDGKWPPLINLLVDLRRHAGRPAARRLPVSLVRIALPLALKQAGLVPKAAPGLLGGARLPLGMSRARTLRQPVTEWLRGALEVLADEADQAYRRLAELTHQHRAWHGALAGQGLRRHARAPQAIDLLAATPVLSIGLVARHLGCSHVAAGGITARLVDLGILIEQTSRSRHKLFVAGDLSTTFQGEATDLVPLSRSKLLPTVDVDMIGATLDGLFADLDRIVARTQEAS